MFDEMKHAAHNVFKATVESVTSVSHVSQFRQVMPPPAPHHARAAAAGAPPCAGSAPPRSGASTPGAGGRCSRLLVRAQPARDAPARGACVTWAAVSSCVVRERARAAALVGVV